MFVCVGKYVLEKYVTTESRRGHYIPCRLLQADGPPDGLLRIELRSPGREANVFFNPKTSLQTIIILKIEEQKQNFVYHYCVPERAKSHSWEVAQKMALWGWFRPAFSLVPGENSVTRLARQEPSPT